MTDHAKVMDGGKVVLPAALCRELGIVDGDSLLVGCLDDGGLTLHTQAQVVKAAQLKCRVLLGDYSVDQFLRDRAEDWGED